MARHDLIRQATDVLRAGCLVRLGDTVYAWRHRDGIIDDGEHDVVQALFPGLFSLMRFEHWNGGIKTAEGHRWAGYRNGGDLFDHVTSIVAELTDEQVAEHSGALTFTVTMSNDALRTAVHTGVPMNQPPTQILG